MERAQVACLGNHAGCTITEDSDVDVSGCLWAGRPSAASLP
eukprot:ctg_5321.g693